MDYKDISITGANSNCSQLTAAEFLSRYRDDLVVFSVMDDAAALMDEETRGIFKSTGLQKGPQQEPGMSYAAVVWGGQVIYEGLSPQKITFTARSGDSLPGGMLPADLEITSAGRISGEEDAVILINGRDYSYHQNGLNIAVYDPVSGKVLDTGIFEQKK